MPAPICRSLSEGDQTTMKAEISYCDQIASHLWPGKNIKPSQIEIRQVAQTKGDWKSLINAPNIFPVNLNFNLFHIILFILKKKYF